MNADHYPAVYDLASSSPVCVFWLSKRGDQFVKVLWHAPLRSRFRGDVSRRAPPISIKLLLLGFVRRLSIALGWQRRHERFLCSLLFFEPFTELGYEFREPFRVGFLRGFFSDLAPASG